MNFRCAKTFWTVHRGFTAELSVGCACIGIVAAAIVTSANPAYAPWDFAMILLISALSGLVTGRLVATRFDRSAEFSRLSGAVIGIAAILLGHVLVLFCLVTTAFAQDSTPLNLAKFLFTFITFTLGSFVLIGWFTLPAGALLGLWSTRPKRGADAW